MDFQVPSSITHENDICTFLKDLLSKHQSRLGSLVPDLSHIHDRAYNHTGIEVFDVIFTGGNQYQLNFKYQWSIYNGCSGLDLDGEEHETVSFTIDSDGYLCFDEIDYSSRTTLNEL